MQALDCIQSMVSSSQIAPTGRMGEDEEDLQERRKQKKDEIDAIIQRAKERREEEERRYQEQLQHAANLKLRKLDERILAEVKICDEL